jgi:hypothetical protein
VTAAIFDRPCGSCDRRQPAMVEMLGPPPWYLCGGCYGTPARAQTIGPQQSTTAAKTPPERAEGHQRGLGLGGER